MEQELLNAPYDFSTGFYNSITKLCIKLNKFSKFKTFMPSNVSFSKAFTTRIKMFMTYTHRQRPKREKNFVVVLTCVRYGTKGNSTTVLNIACKNAY